MNIDTIGLIMTIINGVILASIILAAAFFKPGEKKPEYGKDSWIFYSNNPAKILTWMLPFLVAGAFFPTVITDSRVNIVLHSICWIFMLFFAIRFKRNESCIILDLMKVTVKYKSKKTEDKVFDISGFEGYKAKEGKIPAKLIFSGNREIDLGFINDPLAIQICGVVKRIKDQGTFPEYMCQGSLERYMAMSAARLRQLREAEGTYVAENESED